MKFCYLINSRGVMPENYRFLKNKDSDVFVATWIDNHFSADWFSLFRREPNSTWGEGRNFILNEVKDMDYDYFVFLDDDIASDFENKILEVQDFIEKNEPSALYPHIKRQKGRHTKDTVERTYSTDASFTYMHKDAARTLLPYYNAYEDQSWYYSNVIINYLQYYFYDESRFQYNEMSFRNPTNNKSYSQRGSDWKFVWKETQKFLCEPKVREFNIMAHGRRGDRTPYRAPQNLVIEDKYKINLEKYFNTDHDYYLQKKNFWGQ